MYFFFSKLYIENRPNYWELKCIRTQFLYDYKTTLFCIPDKVIEEMISRGRLVRCLYVYDSESEPCSAFNGIMWELQRKVRQFHQSAETFWLHNGSIVNRDLVEFNNWKPPLPLPWVCLGEMITNIISDKFENNQKRLGIWNKFKQGHTVVRPIRPTSTAERGQKATYFLFSSHTFFIYKTPIFIGERDTINLCWSY